MKENHLTKILSTPMPELRKLILERKDIKTLNQLKLILKNFPKLYFFGFDFTDHKFLDYIINDTKIPTLKYYRFNSTNIDNLKYVKNV